MSWGDLRRRRDAIGTVLEHMRRHPDADLPLGMPAIRDVFASRDELLLALQYDWSQALWVQLELLSLNPPAGASDTSDIAREAWQITARLRPTLRSILDRFQPELERARADARRQVEQVA